MNSARRNRGLGLVEMLISLAISAALLTAAAAGINAAIQAYSVNQTQSDTLHRARLAMHRLTTYIRTSTEHQPVTSTDITDFSNGQTVTDTGIELFDENDDELRFWFDATNRQLMVRENSTDHVLLRGVEAFALRLQPARSATSLKTGGKYDTLARATITMVVRFADDGADTRGEDASRTITLSSASVPRRTGG